LRIESKRLYFSETKKGRIVDSDELCKKLLAWPGVCDCDLGVPAVELIEDLERRLVGKDGDSGWHAWEVEPPKSGYYVIWNGQYKRPMIAWYDKRNRRFDCVSWRDRQITHWRDVGMPDV